MTPLEILQGARELLTPPENWTRGVAARSFNGDEVYTYSPHAVCWCSSGALDRMGGLANRAFDFLEDVIPGNNIPVWNDHSTHEQVLAGFDAAIELAKKEMV